MRFRSILFFSAIVATSLSGSRAALAFEKQHHFGGGIAPGLLSVDDDGLSPGLGLHTHYAYGLNDTFNFLVEGGATFFPIKQAAVTDPKAPLPTPRPSLLGNLAAGVVYNLDVVKFVPYGGILLGGYTLSGGGLDGVTIAGGAQLALGIDWHLSRKVGVGFGFRQHFLLTKMADYPSFSQVILRVEYKWGG